MSSHRVTPAWLLPALPCGRRVSQLPRESRTSGFLFPLSRPPVPLPCHLHEPGSHLRDPQALTWSLDFFLHKCVDSTGRTENRTLQAPGPGTHTSQGPLPPAASSEGTARCLCFHRLGSGSPGTPMSVSGSGSHSSAHAFLTSLLPALILWAPWTTGSGDCM